MTTRPAIVFAAALALGGCGTSGPDAVPETVVEHASSGGGDIALLGVSDTSMYWSVSQSGSSVALAGARLDALPATPEAIATAAGPAVQAGDHLLFTSDGYITRRAIGSTAMQLVKATPDSLAESSATPPLVAWTHGSDVMWEGGNTVSLTRGTAYTELFVTAQALYLSGADRGAQLTRIDLTSQRPTVVAIAARLADSFPDGGADNAKYSGRLVGADDTGAFWLVEELPSKRAILVSVPPTGKPTVLLENITNASAFFVTDDAFYWQEDDALLTSPRSGGSASIAAHLPGPAGAVADGFVYFVDGDAIERLAL